MKKPKCKHCKKTMTYNKILKKWECRNCQCLIKRMSDVFIYGPRVDIVAGSTASGMPVDILRVISEFSQIDTKYVKNPAKIAKSSDKSVKSSAKE